MNTGALLSRLQRQCIEDFRRAEALSAEQARTLSELGQRESFAFQRLRVAGVIRECGGGRFYLVEERVSQWKWRRRLRVLFAVLLALGILAVSRIARGQQQADPEFRPAERVPRYADNGPRVLIDEAHHNFHTASGRYRPFARVLQSDGYRVEAWRGPLQGDSLAEADVLVLANALHESNAQDWSLPNPSAFTREEIVELRRWIEEGGSLLLIADHMPFAGAAAELAAAFGFAFHNGFAIDSTSGGRELFSRNDGSLLDHALTTGGPGFERIDSLRTFTGQAFHAPPQAQVLLRLRAPFLSLLPERPWAFEENTPAVNAAGWSQGALLEIGQGRVAVFGEAAMFTAQYLAEHQLWFGMGSPGAEQNEAFLLNVMHWLSGDDPRP